MKETKRYYRHKIENLLIVSKIVTIHYFKLRPGFFHEPERHDFCELVYTDKGTAFVLREGERIPLRQGEAIFHPPLELHALGADSDANVFIISFVCGSEALKTFENRIIRFPATCKHYVGDIIEEARSTFRLPEFDPELLKLELAEHPRLGGQQLIRIYLESLLIRLLRELDGDAGTFLPQNEIRTSLAADVCEYLSENLRSGLSLAEICRHFGYGKTRLSTLFAEVTGVPVMKYYTALRIEEAKKLLLSGLTVKQVSDELGFDTPNYFSKTFRRLTGETPGAFRKMKI